jgi:hypothetical protein
MDVTVVAAAGAQPQPAPASSGASAPTPATAPAPASTTPGGVLASPPHVDNTGVLSPVVAKIFGRGDTPHTLSVNVSYRVEHPDIIVTVFTDPATGQEIAQVPSEVLVQIAQFFDKESGVTLDRSA